MRLTKKGWLHRAIFVNVVSSHSGSGAFGRGFAHFGLKFFLDNSLGAPYLYIYVSYLSIESVDATRPSRAPSVYLFFVYYIIATSRNLKVYINTCIPLPLQYLNIIGPFYQWSWLDSTFCVVPSQLQQKKALCWYQAEFTN